MASLKWNWMVTGKRNGMNNKCMPHYIQKQRCWIYVDDMAGGRWTKSIPEIMNNFRNVEYFKDYTINVVVTLMLLSCAYFNNNTSHIHEDFFVLQCDVICWCVDVFVLKKEKLK